MKSVENNKFSTYEEHELFTASDNQNSLFPLNRPNCNRTSQRIVVTWNVKDDSNYSQYTFVPVHENISDLERYDSSQEIVSTIYRDGTYAHMSDKPIYSPSDTADNIAFPKQKNHSRESNDLNTKSHFLSNITDKFAYNTSRSYKIKSDSSNITLDIPPVVTNKTRPTYTFRNTFPKKSDCLNITSLLSPETSNEIECTMHRNCLRRSDYINIQKPISISDTAVSQQSTSFLSACDTDSTVTYKRESSYNLINRYGMKLTRSVSEPFYVRPFKQEQDLKNKFLPQISMKMLNSKQTTCFSTNNLKGGASIKDHISQNLNSNNKSLLLKTKIDSKRVKNTVKSKVHRQDNSQSPKRTSHTENTGVQKETIAQDLEASSSLEIQKRKNDLRIPESFCLNSGHKSVMKSIEYLPEVTFQPDIDTESDTRSNKSFSSSSVSDFSSGSESTEKDFESKTQSARSKDNPILQWKTNSIDFDDKTLRSKTVSETKVNTIKPKSMVVSDYNTGSIVSHIAKNSIYVKVTSTEHKHTQKPNSRKMRSEKSPQSIRTSESIVELTITDLSTGQQDDTEITDSEVISDLLKQVFHLRDRLQQLETKASGNRLSFNDLNKVSGEIIGMQNKILAVRRQMNPTFDQNIFNSVNETDKYKISNNYNDSFKYCSQSNFGTEGRPNNTSMQPNFQKDNMHSARAKYLKIDEEVSIGNNNTRLSERVMSQSEENISPSHSDIEQDITKINDITPGKHSNINFCAKVNSGSWVQPKSDTQAYNSVDVGLITELPKCESTNSINKEPEIITERPERANYKPNSKITEFDQNLLNKKLNENNNISNSLTDLDVTRVIGGGCKCERNPENCICKLVNICKFFSCQALEALVNQLSNKRLPLYLPDISPSTSEDSTGKGRELDTGTSTFLNKECTKTENENEGPNKHNQGQEKEEVKMNTLCTFSGFNELCTQLLRALLSQKVKESEKEVVVSENDNSTQEFESSENKFYEIFVEIDDQKKATDELFSMWKECMLKYNNLATKLQKVEEEVDDMSGTVRGKKTRLPDLMLLSRTRSGNPHTSLSSCGWKHLLQRDNFDNIETLRKKENSSESIKSQSTMDESSSTDNFSSLSDSQESEADGVESTHRLNVVTTELLNNANGRDIKLSSKIEVRANATETNSLNHEPRILVVEHKKGEWSAQENTPGGKKIETMRSTDRKTENYCSLHEKNSVEETEFCTGYAMLSEDLQLFVLLERLIESIEPNQNEEKGQSRKNQKIANMVNQLSKNEFSSLRETLLQPHTREWINKLELKKAIRRDSSHQMENDIGAESPQLKENNKENAIKIKDSRDYNCDRISTRSPEQVDGNKKVQPLFHKENVEEIKREEIEYEMQKAKDATLPRSLENNEEITNAAEENDMQKRKDDNSLDTLSSIEGIKHEEEEEALQGKKDDTYANSLEKEEKSVDDIIISKRISYEDHKVSISSKKSLESFSSSSEEIENEEKMKREALCRCLVCDFHKTEKITENSNREFETNISRLSSNDEMILRKEHQSKSSTSLDENCRQCFSNCKCCTNADNHVCSSLGENLAEDKMFQNLLSSIQDFSPNNASEVKRKPHSSVINIAIFAISNFPHLQVKHISSNLPNANSSNTNIKNMTSKSIDNSRENNLFTQKPEQRSCFPYCYPQYDSFTSSSSPETENTTKSNSLGMKDSQDEQSSEKDVQNKSSTDHKRLNCIKMLKSNFTASQFGNDRNSKEMKYLFSSENPNSPQSEPDKNLYNVLKLTSSSENNVFSIEEEIKSENKEMNSINTIQNRNKSINNSDKSSDSPQIHLSLSAPETRANISSTENACVSENGAKAKSKLIQNECISQINFTTYLGTEVRNMSDCTRKDSDFEHELLRSSEQISFIPQKELKAGKWFMLNQNTYKSRYSQPDDRLKILPQNNFLKSSDSLRKSIYNRNEIQLNNSSKMEPLIAQRQVESVSRFCEVPAVFYKMKTSEYEFKNSDSEQINEISADDARNISVHSKKGNCTDKMIRRIFCNSKFENSSKNHSQTNYFHDEVHSGNIYKSLKKDKCMYKSSGELPINKLRNYSKRYSETNLNKKYNSRHIPFRSNNNKRTYNSSEETSVNKHRNSSERRSETNYLNIPVPTKVDSFPKRNFLNVLTNSATKQDIINSRRSSLLSLSNVVCRKSAQTNFVIPNDTRQIKKSETNSVLKLEKSEKLTHNQKTKQSRSKISLDKKFEGSYFTYKSSPIPRCRHHDLHSAIIIIPTSNKTHWRENIIELSTIAEETSENEAKLKRKYTRKCILL